MSHEIAFLTRPKEHERENGDAAIVLRGEDRLLIAVIDALGHGPNAARVVQAGVKAVERCGVDKPASAVVQALHSALGGTRGAAAMVVTVFGAAIEGCGVGNVEMRMTGTKVPIVLSPGVLGVQVRRFRPFSGVLDQPSRVVLFSDGISPRFSINDLRSAPPAPACEQLLSGHGRAHDDATVLVADLVLAGAVA